MKKCLGARPFRPLLVAGLLTALSAAACTPVVAQVQDESWKAEILALQERVRALEESMPLLACGPELRALFRDIRKECNALPPPESEFPGETSSPSHRVEAGTCKTDQLKGAIASAERELDTRSLGQKLISLLRHEVIYLSDSYTISSVREKRLQTFTAERRLPSTRFLIVTAPIPSSGEAKKRAQAVIDRLIQLGVPAKETIVEGDSRREVSRFDKPWDYKVMVPLNQLKPADRPVAPEPRDGDRAVYVFRTECL